MNAPKPCFTKSTTGVISEDGGEATSIVSLDDYVEKNQIHKVDLIKIDVEGFGGNVLRGAAHVIATKKPVIIMEFHTGFDEKDVFCELVLPYYSVFTLDGKEVNEPFKEDYDFIYALPKN